MIITGSDSSTISEVKQHLFRILLNEGSGTIALNMKLNTTDDVPLDDPMLYQVGRIGIGICYDIRFQELAMLYAARGPAEHCQYHLWTSGAHLICYPGAFNMTTGPLHWELLQRARAADNQLYVATCSPARDAGAGYVAWGHSTLVGPFGEILATTEHDEAIIISEVDYSQIELRRTSLPLEKQRRGDLYQLVDVQRLNS
ncbi:hypothetical protein HYC85_021610 [Camellia sinensis]|uniref:CN hydrolase domain-containing protein n=1 Tax=Camellia sinensis TaxID=4442 RepID=A0A7J7GI47_CAMSI|nr:hypothetical protein HYC85_021610 [Camellia sinensis]